MIKDDDIIKQFNNDNENYIDLAFNSLASENKEIVNKVFENKVDENNNKTELFEFPDFDIMLKEEK